jgi:hypothetical protein
LYDGRVGHRKGERDDQMIKMIKRKRGQQREGARDGGGRFVIGVNDDRL